MSKGQARKDTEGGGAYVNNIREAGFQRTVTAKDLLFGKHLLLPKGKRSFVRADGEVNHKTRVGESECGLCCLAQAMIPAL